MTNFREEPGVIYMSEVDPDDMVLLDGQGRPLSDADAAVLLSKVQADTFQRVLSDEDEIIRLAEDHGFTTKPNDRPAPKSTPSDSAFDRSAADASEIARLSKLAQEMR